jgi:hypothetical protein
LVDAFHVPKLLSQQLLLFGRSGDGLEELTFGVEQFSALSAWTWRTVRVHLTDGPRGPGGRSASCLFVACSLCSCSASLSIRGVFEFWLGEVSYGPRVLGGWSAGAWWTVRVLPADGPLFVVCHWRFWCLFRTFRGSGRTVRGKGADSPRLLARQSARPRFAGQSARGSQLCSLVQFLPPFVLPRVLQGIVPKT